MDAYEDIFVCPNCKEDLVTGIDNYTCGSCNASFSVHENVPCFVMEDKEAEERSQFWNEGWGNRVGSEEGDHHFFSAASSDELKQKVLEAIKELKDQQEMIACEVNPKVAKDKTVLNIGCGAGMEGPILTNYGARYIGVDFSFNAVRFTAANLRKLEMEFKVAQADAECLPIRSSSIDVIYSYGVLHHTPNTQKTFDEVFRTLKPGGTAFIALYSTRSTHFVMERLQGTIKSFFQRNRDVKWYMYGEGAWDTEGLRNLWTKTYTEDELLKMLVKYNYSQIKMRRSSSALTGIPYLSRLLLKFKFFRKLGYDLAPLLGSMIVMTLKK